MHPELQVASWQGGMGVKLGMGLCHVHEELWVEKGQGPFLTPLGYSESDKWCTPHLCQHRGQVWASGPDGQNRRWGTKLLPQVANLDSGERALPISFFCGFLRSPPTPRIQSLGSEDTPDSSTP
jgi:hypothetical protein